MEAGMFKVEVYTGSGLAHSENAYEVVVPGVDGEIGFLAEHCEYVGNLGSGVLKIFSAESKLSKEVVVSGGFARFSNNTLQVVTDYVDTKESINSEIARKEAVELESTIAEISAFEPEFEVVNAKLSRMKAQVELLG